MNTWKLAFTNIKKSISDYLVYFITLILGVALFYIFNAIGDQALVEDISKSGYNMIKTMSSMLTGATVGVAIVLGFLIIYANNFLIRRRKKEFGIYLLLGMGKKQVSKILFCETLIAGLFSLGVGLALGVLGSQYLSILVARSFDADLSAYHFTFSVGALVKTVICFAVMNLIVLVFHAANITRYQLVDLLAAGKKNESSVVEKPVRSIIFFVISAAALIYAYIRVGFFTEYMGKMETAGIIVVGFIANMILFRSLSGFLLEMLRRSKGFYFQNLRSFVTRQFCASIGSSSFSMGIICLMLFVTIATFSAGFSMADVFQGNIREKTPVDFSIRRDDGIKVSEWFEQEGDPVDEWAKDGYVEVPVYASKVLLFPDVMGSFVQALREQFPLAIFWKEPAEFMKLSDFNRLMRVYGQEEQTLGAQEYISVCDFVMLADFRTKAMQEGTEIVIGGVTLHPAVSECIDEYLMMSGINAEFGMIIVPDEVIENAGDEVMPYEYIMAGDFIVSGKKAKIEKEDWLNDLVTSGNIGEYVQNLGNQHLHVGTKNSIRESNNGMTMMVTFLVIYVGTVFLIASAAILALKALSDSIDSQGRYEILKKLGCDRKMLHRALGMQIGVYFLAPLFVAAIHSLFGLRFVSYSLSFFLPKGITYGILVTSCLLLVLYGSYMFATIRSTEKIVGF
ncbi:MAG: ABC transporter permease [Lachnospiraceae bacterium]|nr:ABC transporter permease [Lachnospiraceae bacterium]